MFLSNQLEKYTLQVSFYYKHCWYKLFFLNLRTFYLNFTCFPPFCALGCFLVIFFILFMGHGLEKSFISFLVENQGALLGQVVDSLPILVDASLGFTFACNLCLAI